MVTTTTTAKAVVLLAVLWLWLAVRGGATPSCISVYNKMAPCVGYLTGKADDPSDRCCSGAKDLKDMARSNDDLQAICKCIRSAAADLAGFKRDRAVALPGKCGVHVDFPIGPDVDCSKI